MIHMKLFSVAMACAGMVTETGEATARFLKSIARGEIDPKETINEQAQLGLKRVRSMRAEERPSDCRLASRQLVRNALLCSQTQSICMCTGVVKCTASSPLDPCFEVHSTKHGHIGNVLTFRRCTTDPTHCATCSPQMVMTRQCINPCAGEKAQCGRAAADMPDHLDSDA